MFFDVKIYCNTFLMYDSQLILLYVFVVFVVFMAYFHDFFAINTFLMYDSRLILLYVSV